MFEPGQFGASVIFTVTIAVSLAGLFMSPVIIEKSLFRPYWFLRGKQYGTVVASGFVHADIGHLLMNMFTFYFFAFPLEAHIGTVPFVILYAVGLVASSVYTLYRHAGEPDYATLGASGAIAAVLFAYIVYDPLSTLYIIPFPVPIPAFVFAVCYLGYTYWAANQQRGRINHDAHLWGAISGLLFVAVFEPSAYGRLAQLFG